MAEAKGVTLTVNGEERAIASATSLTRFLTELDFDPRAVAVEYNGEILKRARFAETELVDGDRLEIPPRHGVAAERKLGVVPQNRRSDDSVLRLNPPPRADPDGSDDRSSSRHMRSASSSSSAR